MVTVAAAAIAGAARLAIKQTSRVVVVVVGEYPIIELRMRVAIFDNRTTMRVAIFDNRTTHVRGNIR